MVAGELTENEDGEGLTTGSSDDVNNSTSLSTLSRLGSGGTKRGNNGYSLVPTVSTRVTSASAVATVGGSSVGTGKNVVKSIGTTNTGSTSGGVRTLQKNFEIREPVGKKASDGPGGVVATSGAVPRGELKKTVAGLSGSVSKDSSVVSKLHSQKR